MVFLFVCFVEDWSQHWSFWCQCWFVNANSIMNTILFHVYICDVWLNQTMKTFIYRFEDLKINVSIDFLFCRALKPAFKLLVSVLVCQCKFDTFLFYHECIVMWNWTQHWRLEMSVFLRTTWNVGVLFSLPHRALKPALKTIDVSVGLSMQTQQWTLFFRIIVMNSTLKTWKLMSVLLFFPFFLVHRGIEASIEDFCCQCWFVISDWDSVLFCRVLKPHGIFFVSVLVCRANSTLSTIPFHVCVY